MIALLTGTLRTKSPTEVLIEVNGVGYAVNIPLSTFEKLGDLNSKTTLFTYLHVREDALQLFGFASDAERTLFRELISVSGIGPRIAQSILSGISAADLKNHIVHGNVPALTSIPNVGRKTAERLIVELRDKISKMDFAATGIGTIHDEKTERRSQALLALTSLGYSRQVAEQALRSVLSESNGADLPLEELIKRTLKQTSSK